MLKRNIDSVEAARKYLPRRGLLGTDWPRWRDPLARVMRGSTRRYTQAPRRRGAGHPMPCLVTLAPDIEHDRNPWNFSCIDR